MIEGRARIMFYFDSDDEAGWVYNAIYPETSFFFFFQTADRADIRFLKEGMKIVLDVTSGNPASFRAALSTYLKWIKVSISISGGYR